MNLRSQNAADVISGSAARYAAATASYSALIRRPTFQVRRSKANARRRSRREVKPSAVGPNRSSSSSRMHAGHHGAVLDVDDGRWPPPHEPRQQVAAQGEQCERTQHECRAAQRRRPPVRQPHLVLGEGAEHLGPVRGSGAVVHRGRVGAPSAPAARPRTPRRHRASHRPSRSGTRRSTAARGRRHASAAPQPSTPGTPGR